MKRPRLGDIIEIVTSKGLGYAQYSHKNLEFGSLLRVFVPIFRERPTDFSALIASEPGFLTFFPLGAAVNRGLVTVAAHAVLPLEAQTFPLFRCGFENPMTGKIDCWWLWDGEKEWRVGTLLTDQYRLPLREIINDTLLIERIETGWTAATDPQDRIPKQGG
jgi:hypothetical protein